MFSGHNIWYRFKILSYRQNVKSSCVRNILHHSRKRSCPSPLRRSQRLRNSLQNGPGSWPRWSQFVDEESQFSRGFYQWERTYSEWVSSCTQRNLSRHSTDFTFFHFRNDWCQYLSTNEVIYSKTDLDWIERLTDVLVNFQGKCDFSSSVKVRSWLQDAKKVMLENHDDEFDFSKTINGIEELILEATTKKDELWCESRICIYFEIHKLKLRFRIERIGSGSSWWFSTWETCIWSPQWSPARLGWQTGCSRAVCKRSASGNASAWSSFSCSWCWWETYNNYQIAIT